MDKLEMIEKLRERADITYEEARDILEQAQGDLLEAFVLLEKQGKIRTETAAEEMKEKETQAMSGEAKTMDEERDARSEAKAERREKKNSFFGFLLHSSFHMKRREKELLTMPTWLFAILLLSFWGVSIPSILISLFFECRYSFEGVNTQTANEFFTKAGSFADGVESSLQNDKKAEADNL